MVRAAHPNLRRASHLHRARRARPARRRAHAERSDPAQSRAQEEIWKAGVAKAVPHLLSVLLAGKESYDVECR